MLSPPGRRAKGSTLPARTTGAAVTLRALVIPAALAEVLAPFPYHRRIVDYLRAAEPEHWDWFSSTRYLDEHSKQVRLELLKSCYRFERAEHSDLYAVVDGLARTFDLQAPVTVYQSQTATALNAFLSYVPGEAHVVLEGPLRATLTGDELAATLAHELTHFLIWECDGAERLVADQMLSAMAASDRAEMSHIESARLYRLYLEIHADRGALFAMKDPLLAIGSLIKVQTGLADADAESYLRQSEEIFGQAEVKAEALTHPESFIRARALKLWSEQGAGAEGEVARMVEGPLDLGRLSLLGQQRLTGLTRRLLVRYLQPAWLRTESLLAHSRLFFPDLDPAGEDDARPLADEIRDVSESVRRYLAYVLLDMATVDRALDEGPAAAGLRLAEELGFDRLFLEMAVEEIPLNKRAAARLKKESAQILADAARAAEGTA